MSWKNINSFTIDAEHKDDRIIYELINKSLTEATAKGEIEWRSHGLNSFSVTYLGRMILLDMDYASITISYCDHQVQFCHSALNISGCLKLNLIP